MIFKDPILQINHRLNRTCVPYGVNEKCIEALLFDLEKTAQTAASRPFWLTMARLTELTLLCAGHYADNCEFSAAGDLLVNPRKIRVCCANDQNLFTKDRHGRLSDQLDCFNAENRNNIPLSLKEVACEILQPALLPYLQEQLIQSGLFQKEYLLDVTVRMKRIADTLGFLMAFQASSSEALYRQLKGAGKEQKQFVAEHLCRFDRTPFNQLGRQIEHIMTPLNIPEKPIEESHPQFDLCAIY